MLSGAATDAQEGTLASSRLSWTVVKHHDTHTHPFLPPTTGNNVSITGPDPEDLSATTTTYLEIQLTATDSQGLSQTVTQNLYPNQVNISLACTPSGLGFKVLSQGQNNVTLGKLAAAGGNSILAFYRSSNGTLGLRNDVLGSTTSSATVATSGVWHELLLHASIDSGGKTEVWLDGTPVGALSTTQSLGSNPIGRVQIGNNQTGRTYDMALDDAAVSRPIGGYARPVDARSATASLVPAFSACGAGNATHASPLALSSCSPPAQTSSFLTVGTPDANGQSANSTGSVELRVSGESPIDPTNGDQADIGITAQLTDVRRKSDLSDYAGELQATSAIRITDRYNGQFQDEPATAADLPFSFPMSCQVTADADIGSTCTASTTADALSAGMVTEGTRAVWMLGPIDVYDGGTDGVAATTGDNTLFMRQGLFVP